LSCEFQKDIKFDDIHVGDLVLVELFGEDNWTFLGDRRGTAMRRIGDTWYFKDMQPLYKEAVGYRLFRVTVMDAEWERNKLKGIVGAAKYSLDSDKAMMAREIERLGKIEDGLKEIVEKSTQTVETLKAEAKICRDHGSYSASDILLTDSIRIVAQVKPLEALLNG
jgi:hypothetical protein